LGLSEERRKLHKGCTRNKSAETNQAMYVTWWGMIWKFMTAYKNMQ